MYDNRQQGSMVCPKCGKLISKSSSECFFCGYKNPGGMGFASIFQKLFRSRYDIIQLIMIFCGIIYVFSLLLDIRAVFNVSDPFRLFSPSNISVFKLGATGTIALYYHRWWSVVTAVFLHGSLLHIILNMFWVRQLGYAVEEFYGPARFIIIFILSGIVGFIASIIGGHQLTLGASGSLFGLLGALIYYGKQRGGYFGEAIYRQAGLYAVMFFVFGFMMSGVDNFAHGGGFIGGFLVAMLVGFSEHRREALWHKLLAILLVIGTLMAFLVNIITMGQIR